jgi:hypothetical protein
MGYSNQFSKELLAEVSMALVDESCGCCDFSWGILKFFAAKNRFSRSGIA